MRIALCHHCGKHFKPRAGKRYCSDRCRWEAWRETAHPCYYCGAPAETIDHVPPQSVRPILIEYNVTKWNFVEVDACRECNSLLGARQPWALAERKAKIKELLRKQYRRYLEIPEWTEVELGDLGRGLSDFVAEGQVLQKWLKQRLAW